MFLLLTMSINMPAWDFPLPLEWFFYKVETVKMKRSKMFRNEFEKNERKRKKDEEIWGNKEAAICSYAHILTSVCIGYWFFYDPFSYIWRIFYLLRTQNCIPLRNKLKQDFFCWFRRPKKLQSVFKVLLFGVVLKKKEKNILCAEKN